MSEPIVFQEFTTITEADKVLAIVKADGLSAFVESGISGDLDENLAGVKYGPMYRLMMKAEDFNKARHILSEKYTVNIDEVDSNYMLLSFTNSELQEVVAKPDEWGFYNYNLALALLKSRGSEMSNDKKEELQTAHMHQLAERKSIGKGVIFWGYAVCIVNIGLIMFVINAGFKAGARDIRLLVLPCAIGILVGHHLIYNKKTLPDGSKILVYKDSERKHGLYIAILNAVISFVCIMLYVIYS